VSRVVLDASALLAMLLAEAGAERVLAKIDGATMSTVNLAEAASKMAERGHNPSRALEAVRSSYVTIIGFDEEQAMRVGELRSGTRRQGLSLGDRACLALAEREGATLLTGDRAFAKVDTPVRIELIR
jgi:PIN domain nuclease of toxin-antitoxin system